MSTTLEQTSTTAVRPRATSPAAWSIVLFIALLTLLARLPTLRAYVGSEIVENPDVLGDLTDPHLQQLAVNVGLVLAVAVSLLLLFLYQSLGRALEMHVFTPSIRRGKASAGLFFVISTATVIPFQLLCVALDEVSLRTAPWYYPAVLAVAAAAPFLFRSHWRGLAPSKILVLFVSAVVFGLLATVI